MRKIEGKFVPETDSEFREWEVDKLMHETLKRKAEFEKDMPAFWERQKAALRQEQKDVI